MHTTTTSATPARGSREAHIRLLSAHDRSRRRVSTRSVSRRYRLPPARGTVPSGGRDSLDGVRHTGVDPDSTGPRRTASEIVRTRTSPLPSSPMMKLRWLVAAILVVNRLAAAAARNPALADRATNDEARRHGPAARLRDTRKLPDLGTSSGPACAFHAQRRRD